MMCHSSCYSLCEITSVVTTICVYGNNSKRKFESVVDPSVISRNRSPTNVRVPSLPIFRTNQGIADNIGRATIKLPTRHLNRPLERKRSVQTRHLCGHQGCKKARL